MKRIGFISALVLVVLLAGCGFDTHTGTYHNLSVPYCGH